MRASRPNRDAVGRRQDKTSYEAVGQWLCDAEGDWLDELLEGPDRQASGRLHTDA